MGKNTVSSDIAVIGIACHYPGANDLRQFWENVLAKRRQFRYIPDSRLPSSDYYDPDPDTPDKTYCNKAALIDGFRFDWSSHRIPKSAFDSTDIAHWLALEVALQSLRNAGFNLKNAPNEKTGVILGNTLTGEHSRAEGLRLRWPFVRRTLEATAKAKGLSPQTLSTLLPTMEVYYKSVFAPVTEDTLSGGLSNTIAGRICNYLDFHGGGYTVDGACSSSLVAVATAATALMNGDMDLALAGGVDISLDTFELIGFAKTSALTTSDMRVYDRRANGFIPGEGCGFVVLKRLEDAIEDGNYVYAILRGWGISSDGKGGLTAPSKSGQATALRRAYERAHYSPRDLDFIEGHGTGTVVGDRTELEAISLAMGEGKEQNLRPCGITSLKSIIGHTKAASGIGGFIKAVIAVNRRILPPTANCTELNQVFESSVRSVYPIIAGEVRMPSEKLKAGISAMGFGGINCHVTIESGDKPSMNLAPLIDERKLLVSHQETELFVLGASSVSDLLKRIQEVKEYAQGLCEGELIDLSSHLTRELQLHDSLRAGIVAGTSEALHNCLETLEKMLTENPPSTGETVINDQKDIFIGNNVQQNRVGFLFPGQGSQFLNMGRHLVERHKWSQSLLADAARWLKQVGGKDLTEFIFRPLDRAMDSGQVQEWSELLKQTEIAQPAICQSSLLWINKLDRLGIRPVVVGGHSLGELTAFFAAGAFDRRTLLQLASVRGQAMATPGDEKGIMASLGCSQKSAEEILSQANGYAVIANINSPQQTVISGERSSVEEAVNLARDRDIVTHILAVSNAFHSRFVSSAAEHLRDTAPVPKILGKTKAILISGMKGREIKEGTDLKDHFASQVLSRVDFVSLVKGMSQHCDLILEAGPGKVLSNLANAIIQDDKQMCQPIESKHGKDRDLNTFLANFFVHGGNVKWEALYEDRLVRPFVLAKDRIFIENPCERPFKVSASDSQALSEDYKTLGSAIADKINISPQVLADYLSHRYQFIEAVIKADLENFPSHLSSAEVTSMLPTEQKLPQPLVSNTNDVNTQSAKDAPRDPISISDLMFELIEKRTGFPQESLSMNLRLLDDLNLDSIKAAELIAEASTQLGAAGRIDVSKYANATIEEVVATLDKLKSDQAVTAAPVTTAEAKIARPTWVRNFVVKPVIEKLPRTALKGHAKDWKGKHILILSEPEEHSLASNLGMQFTAQGTQVHVSLFEDARSQSLINNDAFTEYIGILPRASNKAGLDKNRIAGIIDRLRTIASLPPVPDNDNSQKTLAYIQFGGGYFGTQPEVSDIEQCTSVALAASLHFERPDLKVRVLDFSPEINPDQLSKKIITEMLTPKSYAAAGFDTKLTRRVPIPRLQEPANYKPRPVSWTSEDVVLVTGGAKGITAECSLAFAQATNVRMALVGSSPHPNENSGSDKGNEIAKTLDRFKDAGLTASYYQCNIVDTTAVKRLIKQIRRELGNITCVIHGSALNKPGDLDKVSTEEALKEVSPKVIGAVNLCNALKDAPPKLFIGFSSIIGLSGMMRNAWYGFSNEALNLILSKFEQDHPETSVLSIAFSIWDEVGMGVRMGSTKFLAQMGVEAIPVKEGVHRFLQLVMNDPGEKQIVVTARLAGMDTFQIDPFPLAKVSRFLDKIVYYYPQVEVISRAHLSLEKDSYVKDHLWRGTYLFPTVFGLEAMAQAVAYVTGESNFNSFRIEDIHLERPIPVNPENGIEIEIHAEVMEQKGKKENRRIRVGISTGQTGFTVDHFSATFVLNVNRKAPKEKVDAPPVPLDIKIQQDIYNGKLLFQGPLFQRIKQIYYLDSKKCVFRSEATAALNGYDDLQADSKTGSWLIGDPFFRDSLLHSAQLSVSRDISLPIKIKSIDRYRVQDSSSKTLKCVAVIEDRTDREIFATVFAVNESGQVVERIDGYVLRILEHHEDYPRPEEIANPGMRDERIIREEIEKRARSMGLTIPEISADYLPRLHQLNKKERHKKELPILHRAISRKLKKNGDIKKDIQVKWLKSGKPSIEGMAYDELDISLSHDENTLLCVAGSGSQGCDIATVSEREKQEWLALLGSAKEPLLQKLPSGGDSLDRAGTRIWAATEAFRKATNTPETDLTIELQTDDTVVFRNEKSNKEFRTLTFPVKLTRSPEKIVAVVAKPTGHEKANHPPASNKEKSVHVKRLNFDFESYKADIVDGPQGQPVFIFQFPVTFKEASNMSRTLYFSHFFAWIGKLREFMVHPIYDKLVEWFSTGKWGMVTNHAETTILGEAISGDVIEGRLWLDKVYGKAQSSLEFCFEWSKLLPEQKSVLIATSKMSTTWVEIKGHGIVEVKPLPEFGQEFVNKLLPPSGQTQTLSPSGPLPNSDLGKELYSEPDGPVKSSSLLQEQTFETTLEDANLVGNIYFSNYYIWQGRVRDNFLNNTAPEYFVGSGKKGELRCVKCTVNHMSEAMPFDRIAVRMHRSKVYEKGVLFYFDYYRIAADGTRHKLGHGEHEAAWFAPAKESTWMPAELPLTLRSAIIPMEKRNRDSRPFSIRKDNDNKHDVIIVGAGIGGLTAGALLAKQGKRVLVLEQHDKPGGFCTSWERFIQHKGKKLRFVFDAGVHDILGLGPNGPVRKLLRKLDITERIEWKRMDHEYILGDIQLKVPSSMQDYLQLLVDRFPDEREGLNAFFKEIEVCNSEVRNNLTDKTHINKWINTPFKNMIDTFIRDNRLKIIISVLHYYICDDINKLDTLTFLPLFGSYVDGGYYPCGGSQVLPDALASVILDSGGSIQLNTPVSHIIINDGHVAGVKLGNGNIHYSEMVVSNADLRRTFLELVGSEHLPFNFSRRIEKLKPSTSAFIVSLGVDFVPDLNPVTIQINKDMPLGIMSPSLADPSLAPSGHSCITLITHLPHEQATTWNRSHPEYRKRKRRFGNKLIKLAEQTIPKLSDHIIYREDASPATFARYSWATDGAIYGLDINEWRPPTRTPIKGLYITGSGVAKRAGVGEAVYNGFMTAETIIKESQNLYMQKSSQTLTVS